MTDGSTKFRSHFPNGRSASDPIPVSLSRIAAVQPAATPSRPTLPDDAAPANPSAEPGPPPHRAQFRAGLVASLPVNVAVFPFALLFGALAVRNGLGVGEAGLMSALIFGGASQVVGIELFGQHVAPWMVVLSIFAVNFRHVLYSATFGRHIRAWSRWKQAIGFFFLTDVQFAETERRAQAGLPTSFAWYFGLSVGIYLPWVAFSVAGAHFSGLLDLLEGWGLDFLLPIYFLGLLMEFRHRRLWLPVVAVSAVASVAAYKIVGSPWHVSIGGLAGIALAALWPQRAEPRSRA